MNANPKPTKNVPEWPAEKAGTSETNTPTFTALLLRGVERFADLQKVTLDLLSRQTKDISSTVREVLRATPAAPGTVFLELTEQAVEEWMDAQKNVVDLMVHQSAHALECANEGTGLASQSAAVLTELVQQSAKRAITAQKITLDFAAMQQAAISEAINQTGLEETPFAAATYSMQHGLDALIAKQKEFLGEVRTMDLDNQGTLIITRFDEARCRIGWSPELRSLAQLSELPKTCIFPHKPGVSQDVTQ